MKSLFASILLTFSLVALAAETQIYETQEIELKESRKTDIDKTKDLELSSLDEKEWSAVASLEST